MVRGQQKTIRVAPQGDVTAENTTAKEIPAAIEETEASSAAIEETRARNADAPASAPAKAKRRSSATKATRTTRRVKQASAASRRGKATEAGETDSSPNRDEAATRTAGMANAPAMVAAAVPAAASAAAAARSVVVDAEDVEVVESEGSADDGSEDTDPALFTLGVDDGLGIPPSTDDLDVAEDVDEAPLVVESESKNVRKAARAKTAPATGYEIARHDPLSAYIQETRRYPLLSAADEHALAVRYFETGDIELAKQLVTANLRLVVKIAYEYRRAYRNLLDLVQEGNIGLMQAVRKYDPFRGVKLSSYAAWWIRAYILRFVLNNWRLVKIGTTQAQRKLFFNLRKEKERLERMGFEPEHALLAEKLDVTVQDVAEMESRLASADMSLDAPLSEGNDDGNTRRTRLELLPAEVGTRPDVRTEDEEFRAVLRSRLEEFGKTLNGRDRALFVERWLTDSPLTLQEIGDKFGITRERVRQLEQRILKKLRERLEEDLGSAVDIGAIDPDQ
ncbi:MAG: RNA polymerase factor sigma-32 [Pseudomonadota bacterium]